MNQDAGLEPGQDLEEQMIDVAADLADMGGIDKEDVVRFQFLKRLQRDVLNRRSMQHAPTPVFSPE